MLLNCSLTTLHLVIFVIYLQPLGVNHVSDVHGQNGDEFSDISFANNDPKPSTFPPLGQSIKTVKRFNIIKDKAVTVSLISRCFSKNQHDSQRLASSRSVHVFFFLHLLVSYISLSQCFFF